MAQSKMVQIESKRQVRYTTEVVDGNTVRVETASPQIREKELRRTQVEQNRQRALSMNLHYVLFMTIAAVAVVTICIFYLRLQEQRNKQNHMVEIAILLFCAVILKIVLGMSVPPINMTTVAKIVYEGG